MNKIFLESKHENTAECFFVKTLIKTFIPSFIVEYVCMDGVANLFSETIINQINQAMDEGDNVVVLCDADCVEKGWGYQSRMKDIKEKMMVYDISFPVFLFPNNHDDGDVEVLMERLARKDLHKMWWDCFDDYEKCIGGIRDVNGEFRYHLPNRKAKLHTFVSSQRLNNKCRKSLGGGDWLFDNKNYWDLTKQEVLPLLDFLKENFH